MGFAGLGGLATSGGRKHETMEGRDGGGTREPGDDRDGGGTATVGSRDRPSGRERGTRSADVHHHPAHPAPLRHPALSLPGPGRGRGPRPPPPVTPRAAAPDDRYGGVQ